MTIGYLVRLLLLCIICLQLLQPGVNGAHGVVARPHVVVADSKELGDVLEETLVLDPAASSGTATLRTALNVSYFGVTSSHHALA